MGSFGERMRRAREKRGITLDSISLTTKIGTHTLEALEKEEFDKLPGGIFNKGIVRSYASALGMDEEQVVKEFIDVAGDPEQPLPDPPIPRRLQLAPQPKERRSWGDVATVVVCAIAVLLGGWKAAPMARHAVDAARSRMERMGSQPTREDEQSSGVPSTDQPENAAAAKLQLASQKTTPASAVVPAPARPTKFVVLVKAHTPAWVSITADGKPVLEGVLKRKKRIHAYSQVVLRTDNAGALAVSRNGKPLPPLGHQNQQASVTISPESVTQ